MGAAELAQRISRGFFSATPVVLQTEAAECGLACLAMVAAHHGHRTNLPALRQRFTTSLKGLTIRDLVRLGADLKLATRALRLDLVDLKQLRLPCVLHWDHNHFVVLTRVSTTRVVLHDPAIGRRTMRLEEFSRHFTGVALEAWPADGFQPRNERARIHVADFVRHARGIGWAAIQILAISLLLEAATIAMPIGFQLALDEVVVAADYDLLTIIVLALGLLLVLQVITGLVRAWVTLLIGSSLVLQWKASLFDQLMRLPLAFFEKRHVGDVVSRFNSLDAVQRTLTASSIQALLDGVMSILLIFMMGLYGGYLLVIALATAALYGMLRFGFFPSYRAISAEAIVRTAQENSHFMETARGIASLKVLNLEERRRVTWINYLVDRVNAELRVQKFETSFKAASTALFGIDRILVIFLGIRAILADDMSVGALVAFLAYKDQFAARVDGFISTALQFSMLSLHGERIADIVFAQPEETERRPVQTIAIGAAERAASRLDLQNVRFRYAEGEPDVLADLSFTVAAGECLGIAGSSGAGKSTLLKLLAGLEKPTDGQVFIDGVPMRSLGLARYRDRVGCVLQDDRLFAGSIAENIAAFDPAADPAWIMECARMAAIHDEIMRSPMGYESLVGDMGSTLSGGQRQRVILARALYRRPSVLLLDEATSHLDVAKEEIINAAIKRLPMTRVLVAHRQSTLAMTDRVLDLSGGTSCGVVSRITHGVST